MISYELHDFLSNGILQKYVIELLIFVPFVAMLTRILIIRFSSIGDIMLTTPIIRVLYQQLEGEVEIDYITKSGYASMLESNPYIKRVITIEKSVVEQKVLLSTERYDYVVDLHSNLRSGQVKQLVKALAFRVDKRNLAKWIYVNTKREMLSIGQFVSRCFEAVATLGVEDDGKGLDFFIDDHDQVSNSRLPNPFQSGYMVYAIGGKMKGKILPTEKIVTLCRKIDRPIVLIGGQEDQERGAEIAKQCGQNVLNACSEYSIGQSASIMAQAECVITHDTGMMHIAAALKKKVISLWFATTPQLGFAPWQPGEGSKIIEAECKKRPTSKLGNRGYADGGVFNIDLNLIANSVD